MKAIPLITKALFAIFFVICVAVHVLGLFKQITNEPTWSHIVHTISYCVCLYTLFVSIKYRLWVYIVAASYPFVFHVNCAWHSYVDYNKFNAICILVIIMMPLAAVFIWNMEQENLSSVDS